MEDRARSKGKKGITIAILAIFAFGGFAVYNYLKQRSQVHEQVTKTKIAPVEVFTSVKKKLDWFLEQTGEIRPMREVMVQAKVPGRIIRKLYVERGDFVTKGQIVATLEDSTIKAQVREAAAGLESAGAGLKQAEANLAVLQKDRERLATLVRKKVASIQKLDHIDAQYRAALAARELSAAQIKRAEAGVSLLKIVLDDHTVRASISGQVSARYVDQGAMSSVARPIIRISEEQTVKVVTAVTEKDYPHVKKGMEAEVRVDSFPGRTFKGVVYLINPTLDPGTRTAEVEIHIPNRNLTLRSGMFAHVRLFLGQREALVIPRDALINLPGTGNYYVFLAWFGYARQTNVTIGISQGNYVEVLKGLKPREPVIIKGQGRLRDGSPVVVVKGEKAGK